ncbi:MAG: helix-turn-helix domain-containing protein [Chloroflexota bacterium]
MEKDKKTRIQRQFGKQVRKLRFAKGYSQEELAFRANVHRTYLGGIERGERNPSLKNMAAIAEALGVSLAKLFETEVDFKGEDTS